MVDELDDLSSSRISKVGLSETGDDIKGSRMRLFIKEVWKTISREDEEKKITKFRANNVEKSVAAYRVVDDHNYTLIQTICI